jgi:hypothetical protein
MPTKAEFVINVFRRFTTIGELIGEELGTAEPFEIT